MNRPRKPEHVVIAAIVCGLVFCAAPSFASGQDTFRSDRARLSHRVASRAEPPSELVTISAPDDLPEDHSPRGAVWRAAALPGWGQYYNRQYYKIPIVWAGLGGITASALYVNRRYLLYRHAFHFVAGTNTSERYEEDYLRLLRDLGISKERGPELEDAFRRTRDNLRRNRDLLYIGIGLFYGLSILDAYVNAHLLDFDVGEDLAISAGAGPNGITARFRLRP